MDSDDTQKEIDRPARLEAIDAYCLAVAQMERSCDQVSDALRARDLAQVEAGARAGVASLLSANAVCQRLSHEQGPDRPLVRALKAWLVDSCKVSVVRMFANVRARIGVPELHQTLDELELGIAFMDDETSVPDAG